MRLLVSVRSASEAAAALAGGADIVDAKEPARGSLGAVNPATLAAILERVPPGHAVSVALGDLTTTEEVRAAIASLPLPERSGPSFVKLGFAGVIAAGATGIGPTGAGSETMTAAASNARMLAHTQRLLAEAVRAARAFPNPPGVIAVAYADARQVHAPDLHTVREAARDSGVRGVLLDTSIKNGRTLLDLLPINDLAGWIAAARGDGLLTALAGSLDAAGLDRVLGLGADIVGVRGAACNGGREGVISSHRVATLACLCRHTGILAKQPGPSVGNGM